MLYLSYKIQLQLDKLHKKGWVTNLKQLLFSNGFGHVWISQEVGGEALFLREFILRLQDIARQNWRADLESSAKLSTNSEFKSLLNPEKYLKVVKNYFIPRQLAKLRTSNHDLMIISHDTKALRLRIEHVNSVTCNGLKTNTIFFSSVQNMMICDENTCHGIM